MNVAPILLDTNLIILLIVGNTSPTLIAKHKRLKTFTVQDYEILVGIISNASSVLVTPNTLTETSNLAGQIAEPARSQIFNVFRSFIKSSKEMYISSNHASDDKNFIRLGLTDVALIEASPKEATLYTTDLDLYLAAIYKGVKAINFNHLRNLYL